MSRSHRIQKLIIWRYVLNTRWLYFVCIAHPEHRHSKTHTQKTFIWLYLMDDEWTLKTTFAGAITQKIGLDLVQTGKSSATGTTKGRQRQTVTAKQTQRMWRHMQKFCLHIPLDLKMLFYKERNNLLIQFYIKNATVICYKHEFWVTKIMTNVQWNIYLQIEFFCFGLAKENKGKVIFMQFQTDFQDSSTYVDKSSGLTSLL